MAAAAEQATRKLSWGYIDDIGPERWGSLTEEWAICDVGKNQSPIEISDDIATNSDGFALRPQLDIAKIPHRFIMRHKELNAYAANKTLILEPEGAIPAMVNLPDVGRYRLTNLHFHTGGSEHVLNGKRARMECHFVFELDMAAAVNALPHGSGARNVVIGVMFSRGDATTPWLSDILRGSIDPPNADVVRDGKSILVDLSEAIPNFSKAKMYTYDGSFTTPPGTEGVHYILMADRAVVTEKDCILLENFQGGPNTRPLQETAGRVVVRFNEVRYGSAIGA